MLADIGMILVGLALAVALYAACAVYWSIRTGDSRWAKSGQNGVYAVAGILGLALVILWAAFLSDQFQIEYVALHSNRALPTYLKISALWAGQDGSLLLWAFLQALFTMLAVIRPSKQARPLIPWATVFLNLITAFFVAVTLFLSNPFRVQDMIPLDGQGMNPLLRHPGMVFHPPALYLGYVGLAVPFAFAMAALVTRKVEDWPGIVRRWTVAAWGFLGLGLLLGARWAYDVLGWGGYWGWDPVENAGLMPWLTATALLHSTAMQDQRGGFRWWNLFMAVMSFELVLFGTFTTRSGLIQSVHAFSRSVLGPYFLAAIGVSLLGALVLAIIRRSTVNQDRETPGIISREGLFLITMILFSTITASVLVGSILPTITEATGGQRFEAGPEWFDRVTGPQFAALVLVLGLCPILGRSAATLSRLRQRGLPIIIGGIAVPVVGHLIGLTGWASTLGFVLVGLAGGTAVAEFIRDVVARKRSTEEGALQALWNLIGRNRRRYGGYLVHIGIILMALGIIGTRMHPLETEEVFTVGEPVEVGDYTLVYEDIERSSADEYFRTTATFSVYYRGAYLITLKPWMDDYFYFDQTVATPALRPGLREDLYMVLAGWTGDGASVTTKIYVNELASFLWLGGLIFLAGGAVSVWPAATTERVSPHRARQRALWSGVGLIGGLIALVASGMAMWGPSPTAVTLAAARPLVGQQVPDFTLETLDGSALTLSDLRGQPVVLNFWATWCPPCEDELPDLQAVWSEYEAEGVSFVGIVYQDDADPVQDMVDRFGLTYPIGIDLEDRIASSYGITGVPETFVLDPDGVVEYVHIGPVGAEELRTELDDVLGR